MLLQFILILSANQMSPKDEIVFSDGEKKFRMLHKDAVYFHSNFPSFTTREWVRVSNKRTT